MPIAFTCPHCGYHTEVAESFAGQSGPCIHCGRRVTIPALPGPRQPQWVAPVETPSRQQAAVAAVVAGAVLFVAVCVVGWLLFSGGGNSPSGSSGAGQLATCRSNMARLAQALLLYHRDHGYFPAAYTTDAQGQPLLSWRVELLPYLGEQALYDRIDKQRPWNHPNNAALAVQMPRVFACPAAPAQQQAAGIASYVGIAGPGCLFDGAAPTRLGDIRDGVKHTLLLVEVADSNINWMEPRDLDFATARWTINGDSQRSVSSRHTNGAHVATADGMIHFIDAGAAPLTEDDLRGLATIAGGEAHYLW
jgi:hypothetical protein